MEYKLTKLEYELIKKYIQNGYKYVSIDKNGKLSFSNYPVNQIKIADVYLNGSEIFTDFDSDKDYLLEEIIENVFSVK